MIGIFDSGLGGLTVVKPILERLPQYQIIYLGDTARLPYGNRSREVIYEFTLQGVNFLFSQGCEIVILACNTATSLALRKLQREWLFSNYPERRVLGVIRPLAEKVIEVTKNKKVGVIGTRATVESKSFEKEIRTLDSSIHVFGKACPLLVPLIEEGWTKRPETKKIARSYLRALKFQRIDTLIMGCTHFPLIRPLIQGIMGKSCYVLDSGSIVAQSLKDYFVRHPEIEQRMKRGTNHSYFVTDISGQFECIAQEWLGQRIQLLKVAL